MNTEEIPWNFEAEKTKLARAIAQQLRSARSALEAAEPVLTIVAEQNVNPALAMDASEALRRVRAVIEDLNK